MQGKIIRKHQDILQTSGYGLIVLSIWAITKSLLYCLYIPELVTDAIKYYLDVDIAVVGISVGLIAFFVVDFCIKLFVGFSAIKEGKSESNKKIVYIVLSFILIISCLLYLVYDILLLLKEVDAVSIISIIADFVHLMILASIIVSGLKLRKYNKGAGK